MGWGEALGSPGSGNRILHLAVLRRTSATYRSAPLAPTLIRLRHGHYEHARERRESSPFVGMVGLLVDLNRNP